MNNLSGVLLPALPPNNDRGCSKAGKTCNKRTNIIVFNGSFHGRTHLTMAMTTSKPIHRKKYQPLVSGILVTPYSYCYSRTGFGGRRVRCSAQRVLEETKRNL